MEFNEQQKEIINSVKGAYLVSAPVGTGKTTVLTERVFKALEQGIKPEEILCLTFTNRAAEEMRERIKKRINKKEEFDKITIKTFHGFCAYFIKTEAKEIGINSDFCIFDDDDQVETMKEILKDYPHIIDQDKNIRGQILKLVDELYKYRLNKVEREIGCDVLEIKLDKDLEEINEKYLDALKYQNALDFNELVILTMKSLYLDKKLGKKWQKKYKFIQLDEFQDTHLSEYLVVKELAKKHKNIAFIGDLDQTIYGWRGSEPYFIVELIKKHFAPVREMWLEINYRFDENILESVKSFLKSFKKQETKKIVGTGLKPVRTDENNKKCVDVFRGHSLAEESSFIIDSIKNIRDKEPDAKIAVLTRANYCINQIAEIFTKKNVAHVTVDKYDFFRRQEVKDIYAYLKIIFNKFDLESSYRLIQRPPRNIGQTTLNNIREEGNNIGLRVSDFLNFKNYNFLEPFDNLINKWSSGRIIVLDTETTGTNTLKDEIIQVYATEVINGKIGKDFHFYLKNNIPVGSSYDVHGITDEFLTEKGRNPKKVLEELKEFINNDITIGHNINFDLTMIIENSKRLGINFEFKEYYDTLDISRRLIDSASYKLTSLSELLGLATATHDAKDDVLATVGLLEVLVGKLKVNREKRIDIFKKYSKKFIKLAGLINSWQKIAKEKRPAEALEYIWEDSGLKEFYTSATLSTGSSPAQVEESEIRLRSINDLKDIFKQKDDLKMPADIVLRELIHFASLVKDINFLGLEQGKIPIVTVHQVKGLEFDYVFIIGVNEFKFPINKIDIEEEKRLFYVAMTRAKKKIFISYSAFNDYGRPISKSRFIDYIDKEYINFL
ncbi:MAG: 3'-5' exonuclease [Candidatus Falkowbacteria bacterium]